MYYWSWWGRGGIANVYVLLKLVEKTPNVYVLLELVEKQPMCMYKCITGVGEKNIPCVCTHVLLESPPPPPTPVIHTGIIGGKKYPMYIYIGCFFH
jgi:hypothetical protein